jgi:hypothetical protein
VTAATTELAEAESEVPEPVKLELIDLLDNIHGRTS